MPQNGDSSQHHSFGELLGLLYTRAGLTQEALAQRAEVSSAAVRNWLRGVEEGGHGIAPGKLRKVIEGLLHAGAFTAGEEKIEARGLWHAAKVKAAFDERWFSSLLLEKENISAVHRPNSNSDISPSTTDNTILSSIPPFLFSFNSTIGLTDPGEFYGREQERARLELQTHRQQSTLIVGASKIGKTWLMDYLRLTAAQRLGRRFYIGHINALSPSCMTIEGFTSAVAKQFGVSPTTQHIQQGLAFLEQIIVNLLENNTIPVLCIDGFDIFAKRTAFDQHFFTGLCALAQMGLCLVTTSKQQLIDIRVKEYRLSSLINVFDPILLEPFTEKEATSFVIHKGARAGFVEQEYHYLLQYGKEENTWPPARLQLVGEMLMSDKTWGNYHPDDALYWQSFTERLEERYRGVSHH